MVKSKTVEQETDVWLALCLDSSLFVEEQISISKHLLQQNNNSRKEKEYLGNHSICHDWNYNDAA